MMDRDSITRTGARAPGVEQQDCSNGGAQAHNRPDTERGYTGLKAGGAKEGCKPDGRDNWAPLAGKAPFDKPTLKPYWEKLTVRNFRADDGNVGIIRSPVRAIVLPDTTEQIFRRIGNSEL